MTKLATIVITGTLFSGALVAVSAHAADKAPVPAAATKTGRNRRRESGDDNLRLGSSRSHRGCPSRRHAARGQALVTVPVRPLAGSARDASSGRGAEAGAAGRADGDPRRDLRSPRP